MKKNKILCKLVELITEIPDAGGLAPRCRGYLFDGQAEPDIVIDDSKFRTHLYPDSSEELIAYMEAAAQFYSKLVDFDGFYLHSSAVEYEGRAYLFSGPCGTGKSTHTRLWQKHFGADAKVFNDDKPALRKMDGIWYAYGTPFCGKDGININTKVPLAGICFLKQSKENKIRRLSELEALEKVLTQTFHKFKSPKRLDKMLDLLDMLVREIPIFEMENRPEPAAVELSYNTILNEAKEKGL